MLRSLALLALTTAPALALASALGGAAGIDWTATFEGALERAAAEERVVFIAVNMDGERANERMVDKVYGDRDIQRLASETVNLIASADRHRKSGKCPRFGCADCDEHRFVDIAEVKLLAMGGVDQRPRANAVGFDGVDDLQKLPEGDRQEPGAPLQPWSAVALSWDDDFVYLAVVSEAFEDPLTPFLLYLEADPGPATAGVGLEYSGQVPQLPFQPTHAVALRRQHDAGDGVGPWSGVWVPASGTWRPVHRLAEGRDVFVAADQHTLSAIVPRHVLGDPERLRVAGHVVYGVSGEEWKETVPAEHTPWAEGGGSWLLEL